MAKDFGFKDAELIENGYGGEFEFLDELITKFRPSGERPVRIMRFYRYHENYVAYRDLGYLSFTAINGNLELRIPVKKEGSVVLVLPRSTLRKQEVEYRTTYIPEVYKKR